MVTIASFNVNSINARLPVLLEWLRTATPDIVCLQELKCLAEAFPHEALGELGYNVALVGQKSWNGVALLSKAPIEVECEALPGDPEDIQARYLQAVTAGLRVGALYLPNGNPVGTEKYPYKLAWMARLRAQAELLLDDDMATVLAGDFNVIPEPEDCHDAAAWAGDALFLPETRAAWRSILHLGYYDAFRVLNPDAARAFTFWDYQAGALRRDHGIRIDHLLLSAGAVDRLRRCWIDKEPRGWPKASDHTPILAELA